MRQTRVRALSLLLALAMCLSLLPAAASAAGGSGDSVTAYAQEGEGYTVTFDANGGRFPDGTIAQRLPTKNVGGENLVDGAPPNPVRDGYTFQGWYRESVGENPSVFNYNFQGDASVYAAWQPDLAVTFDPNGGTCAVKTLPLENGVLKGPLPTPVREGYTFAGWHRQYRSDSDTGRRIDAGEAFTAPETVTAVWTRDGAALEPVRVDFFANGGRITSFNGAAVPAPNGGTPWMPGDKYGTGMDQNSGILWTNTDGRGLLPAIPAASRTGYTFDGWYPVDGDSFWDTVGSRYDAEVFTSLSGQKLSASTVHTGSVTYAAKWVQQAAVCTVTFRFLNVPNDAPDPVKVPKGSALTLPKVTVRGYELKSWGTGILNEKEHTFRQTEEWEDGHIVNEDVTLYAFWEPVLSKEDTYDFSNSSRYFDNYRITKAYFDYLTQDDLYRKAAIWSKWYNYFDPATQDDWGGSCFGMSAVYCMARGGVLDLSVFQGGSKTLRSLDTPRESRNVQDLINYYMMAQSTEACQSLQRQYIRMERSKRYEQMVSVLRTEKDFTVLCFTYGDGGHAIVARSIETGSDGEHVEIWDPNYPEALGELVIQTNGRSFFTEETSNAKKYNTDLELRYLLPLSTRGQTYDRRNLQSVFGKAGAYASRTSNSSLCILSSSAADFTVTASNGKSAVVKNGRKASGELALLEAPLYGVVKGDYRFLIDERDLEGAAITLDGRDARVSFLSGQIYVDLNVDNLNSVVIGKDQVTTACSKASEQEITLVSKTLGDVWNQVSVTGRDNGFTLDAESGQLRVRSRNNVKVTVQGRNVDSQKNSGKQSLDAVPSGTAVAMSALGAGTSAPSQGSNPFTDVSSGAYYYDAVLWAVEKGVTGGTTAVTFSPNNPCTRAQIVTFLWRAAGSPKPASGENPFTDVQAGAYYYDAVLWAVEKGITGGTTAVTFSPNASCTRGQTVTFLYRAAGSPAANGANPFVDVSGGAYYTNAVLWAVEKGITGGTTASTFSPGATVTRGQTVTFLYRSQGK